MKPIKKKKSGCMLPCLFILVMLIIVGAGGGLVGYSWYTNATTKPAGDSTDKVALTVAEGDTLLTIAKTLEEQGLIKSELALKVYLRVNSLEPAIKLGDYSITKNLTLSEVINILEKGVVKKGIDVTTIDGSKYEEIAEYLDKQFDAAGEDKKFDKQLFINICDYPDNYTFAEPVQTFLTTYKPAGKSLRGFIFPDTYNLNSDSTSQIVIETFIKNFEQKIIDNGIDITTISSKSDYVNTLYDAITLASIIQKESGRAEDDKLISGVFHNRLNDDYPLQSDVTINYALNNSNPDISIADTKVDSPYNTYLHAGLPPTPINEPGIAAIVAAIEPATTDYFFFLYDKSFNVHFAVTFEEHQINISNFLD